MTLLPGTTVGRYQILEPLGQGGMATVYKAFQPSLQREVALKVLRPGYAQDQEFRERFEREAIAIAKLRHPNIVQVFDFEASQSGEYVLAMEFLEGGTLKERTTALAAEGRGLDPAESVRIIGEVAQALGYAHDKGIVHRDVKPSNVMLTERDRAVVTDFGIARILGATSHTQTGVGIGTPEYMAPEQGQGQGIDHRADIYSLGAMAFELLTGRVPYSADTPLAVVLAHIKDPLPLPSKVNPTIGKGTERALLKALAKDPAQRFDSATAFADALKSGLVEDTRGGTTPTVVVRGSAGAAPARGRAAAAARPVTLSLPPVLSRRPVQLGVAGALVVAVVSGAVLVSGALRPATVSGPPAAGEARLPARGALIWQAKLDGTQADVRDKPGGPPGSSDDEASVRFVPGAIEYVVAKPTTTGSRVFLLAAPARETFVLEMDIDPAASFNVTATWWEANEQRYDAVANVRASNVRFQYSKPLGAATDTLATSGSVDAVRKGNPFTFVVVVDRSRFAAYVDGREVLQGAPDGRVPPAASPIKLGIAGSDAGTLRLTGIRVYELPAGTQAVSSPVPARGALLWKAKLDGTDTDVRSTGLGLLQDATASEVRYVPGAIEVVVHKAQGSRNLYLSNPSRETFVVEVDVQSSAGGGFQIGWWGTAADPRYRVTADFASGRMQLQHYASPAATNLSAALVADAVRRATPVTIALVVEPDMFTAFAGERQVVQAAPDGRIKPAAVPLNLFFSGTDPGTLRLTGIRMYELPPASALPSRMAAGAVATPASDPAATPKFAIPAKGKVVFEAKLDGTGNDLTRPITQMGDTAATAIRQVPGAIELEVVKPSISQSGQCPNCIQASATFSLPRRSTYVGEFEIEVRPRSDMTVHFQLYNVRGAGYYLGLQTVGTDGREGTIFLGCTPGVANCPVNSLVTDHVRIPPAGQRFTIGIDLREDRIAVFLDQKEVLKVATLMPLNGLSSPTVQISGPQDLPGTGLVRLLGARFYELP